MLGCIARSSRRGERAMHMRAKATLMSCVSLSFRKRGEADVCPNDSAT